VGLYRREREREREREDGILENVRIEKLWNLRVGAGKVVRLSFTVVGNGHDKVHKG